MTKAWGGQGNSWALGITGSRGSYAIWTLAIFYLALFIYLDLHFLCRMVSDIQKIWLLTVLKCYIRKLCHWINIKDLDLTFLLQRFVDPRRCPSLVQCALPLRNPQLTRSVCGRGSSYSQINSTCCVLNILFYHGLITFWGLCLSYIYLTLGHTYLWKGIIMKTSASKLK